VLEDKPLIKIKVIVKSEGDTLVGLHNMRYDPAIPEIQSALFAFKK